MKIRMAELKGLFAAYFERRAHGLRTLKWGLLPLACGLLAAPLSTAAATFLYLEAESGPVTAPMAVFNSSLASEGRYVASPTLNMGSVSYSIYVPAAGNYVIWCRVLAPDYSSDSFFVSANGGPEDIYDVAEGASSSAWQWSRVNGRGGTGTPQTINPRLFTLAQGWNRFDFRARDPHAGLDRLILTTDLSYSPYAGSPLINVQPQDQGVSFGSDASFGVVATGSSPLHYQWRYNDADLADGANIVGAQSSTLLVRNVQPFRTGKYSVEISNGFGAVTSRVAMLAVRGYVQSEVDRLPAGSTLNLLAGIYWENLNLCKNFTLQGAGMTSTILDGNAADTVVTICSGAHVTLRDLTIRNGRDQFAGGITNAGNLTLSSVLVTNNEQYSWVSRQTAGGLYNAGTALIQDSIFYRNITGEGTVGGIYNTGVVQVIRSALLHNGIYGSAGAIYNDGSMYLTDATVDNNGAHGIGGIVNRDLMYLQRCTVSFNSSDAIGGIHNLGTMALTNCTVSRNWGDAEEGGIGNSGVITLESCTVCSNKIGAGPGAVVNHTGGTFRLRNTIIALNYGSGTLAGLDGDFISLDYNLIGGLGSYSGRFTLSGQTNHNILGVDPLLGPLQDNGGLTKTHALLAGSRGIDAGPLASFMPTDQRGVARPRDGDNNWIAVADIGAYEKGILYASRILWVRILPSGRLHLSCLGAASRTYSLQTTTTMAKPVWTTVATFTPGPDGIYNYTNATWRAVPTRFYRTVEE